MICFRSSAVWCSSRSLGSTPKRRTIALESALSALVTGAVAARNQFSGRETRRAVRSAWLIASIFGTCSPTLMWSAVTRVKAIASESADRDAVREAAEDRLEQLRQRGLAEEADADRGHRDPDLAGGERLVDRVELLDHRLGAALAFLGELLDLAAAAAHERELGRDEEAVDRDQQQQEDEQQDAHRLCGPVLRAGTSSAIRRREYSCPSRGIAGARCKCDIERTMRVATLSEMLEEVVRLGEATGMERTPTSCAASSRAGWRRSAPRSPGRLAAGDRAGVARPAPRRRPLDPGDDLDRRRRGRRRRPPGLKSARGRLGRARGLSPDVVVVDALRLVRRGRPGAGAGALGADRRRSAPSASSRSTRPRPSPTPARAWSTASSCSATSSTPTWSTRRATSASPSCGRRRRAGAGG